LESKSASARHRNYSQFGFNCVTPNIFKSNPGLTFTITCSPSSQIAVAHALSAYPPPECSPGEGVQFKASVPPPATGITTITSTNPSNPTPLVLTTSTTLPVPLSATLSGPKNGYAIVKATLYDSTQNPVATLPMQVVGLDSNGKGIASFGWDGTVAGGTMASPGVYLFQFNLIDNNGNVLDADKSSFLTPITSPSANALLVSNDGITATYQASYGLASTDNPPISAAAGKVDVYDPNETLIYTYTMQSGDLTPGQHTVSVPIPSPTLDGNYTFLVSAQDNDANNDVAGRQRWALQHNQKGAGLPPIVYIKSDIFHVAWCRGGKNVDLTTNEIDKTARTTHFITKQFQQGATLPNTVTAASNGAFFGYFAGSPPLYLGSLPPIGGIGIGTVGHWDKTYTYSERQLFSFGMTEQGGGFGSAPMKVVILQQGRKRVRRYTVATSIQQTYPYGFGCVGLLVNNGSPVGYNDFHGQWNTAQLSPTSPEPRTALGWTTNHDFFIVTCNGVNNTPTVGQGKSWDDVKNFFVTGLPQIIQQKYQKTINISGAVMLDGGGSTMFAYRNVNQKGGNVQTDQGAPQGDSRLITDYILAVGDTSK